jgi:hypothetical protein
MGYHYIPKFYLKGFVESGSPDVIFRYEKGKTHILRTTLNNVAQETGFYTDDTEAYLSEEVEGPANAVISKMRLQESLSQDDRQMLAQYIVVLFKRVPNGRERTKKLFEEMKGPYFKAIDLDLQKLIDLYPEKAPNLITKRMELQRIISENRITPDPIWERNLPAVLTPSVLDAIPRMTWQFFRASPPEYFVTSDNPVFFFASLGVGNPQSELTFPISSEIALWATWRRDLKEQYVQVRRQAVLEVNRRMVSGATKYVFCSKSDKKIAELVNKIPQLNRIR